MPKHFPPVCNYEGSDYQESFWGKGERAYEDAVEGIALQRLLPPSGKWLLELGAGAGRNTPRYTGFKNIVLLDYSTTQLVQAQARLGKDPHYKYIAADVYHLPFVDGLFDAATMIRALHHMVDAPAALTQVSRVLRTDATFILEFANKRNLKSVSRYLMGRQKWNPFSPEPVEFEKLNLDFHPKTIRRWLKELDFKIQKSLTVSHFRVSWLKKHIPLNLLVGLDALLQGSGSWCQYTPSVFVKSILLMGKSDAVPGIFFQCPMCNSVHLNEDEDCVVCKKCQRKYPIKNGIYDFRMK